MNSKNKVQKNIIFVFLVLFLSLTVISSVYGLENVTESNDVTVIEEYNTDYYISSDLPNSDVQSMLDNAVEGSTFEFTDKEYKDYSLVVDKKVNLISTSNSSIYVADTLTSKAQEMGYTTTAGFYFTPNSSGSLLSGFTIIPSNGYGIYLDGSNGTIITNNVVNGGTNGLLVNNSHDVIVSFNKFSNANVNGLQVQNSDSTSILNNTAYKNQRSGIELTNVSNSNVYGNNVSYNSFNGITMYGTNNDNLISRNTVYENLNGVYIDSKSSGDRITLNTIYSNRKNPSSELGGFETGNGVLIGPNYNTMNKNKVEISYNYLAHNENFQVKNNPLKETMKIEPNFYDSNDDSDTFICPMLLGKILTMELSISNGIGLQVYEDNKPVEGLGTFDTKVIVDGNEYTVTVENGVATLDLDPTTEHTVEYQVGNKKYEKTIAAQEDNSGDKTEDNNSPSDDNTGGNTDNKESSGSENNTNNDSSSTNPTTDTSATSESSNSTTTTQSNGEVETNSTNDGSSSSITTTTTSSANIGVNTSDIYIEDTTSTQGDEEASKGEQSSSSASSSSSESSTDGETGKSYELSPAKKISKSITDNSAIVIIAIVILVIIFAVGYKRKNNFN